MLLDRPLSADGYRTRCGGCAGTTFVDAETYHRVQHIAALIPCTRRSDDVPCGPDAATILDPAHAKPRRADSFMPRSR